jgi:hypothetical protein
LLKELCDDTAFTWLNLRFDFCDSGMLAAAPSDASSSYGGTDDCGDGDSVADKCAGNAFGERE